MSDNRYDTMLAAMMLNHPVEQEYSGTHEVGLSPEWSIRDGEQFVEELRQWIKQAWSVDITVGAWWQRVAEAGLAMPTWPRAVGGIGAPTALQELVEAEMAAAKLIGPPLGGGLRAVGPALREHATPAQSDRMIGPLLRGQQAWCALMREPATELPEVATTATNQRGTWTISGLKLRAPRTDLANRAMVLACTDPAAMTRQRLTMFVVDLDQAGVANVHDPDYGSVISFDDVPALEVLGAVNSGWKVAQTVLGHEKSSLAGRVRRGLVVVPPGVKAAQLDRPVSEAVAEHRQRPARVSQRGVLSTDRRKR